MSIKYFINVFVMDEKTISYNFAVAAVILIRSFRNLGKLLRF